MLYISGPLRSFLSQGRSEGSWSELFPPLTSAMGMLTSCTLFTLFINVWALLERYVAPDVVLDSMEPMHAQIVASVLFPAALMTGTLLFLRQRMVLPFGAVTYILLANALIMLYIRFQWTSAHAVTLLAPLLAGLLGDWLLTRSPGNLRIVDLRRFAFLVPFVHTLSLFIILQLSAGMWWKVHMWVGVIFLAGAVGLGMGTLLSPKALPQES